MSAPEEERLRSFLAMMDALPAPAASETPGERASAPAGLAGMLSSALSALSPGGGGDTRAAFLRALRPFLSPARRERVEGAITAMRLADVAHGAVYGDAENG